MCFPLRTVAFRGHGFRFRAQDVLVPHYQNVSSIIKFGISEKDIPFNYRKWNILAFRGRLMSLISPRSLAYSICWDRLSLSFTASFFTPSQLHKRFNLFIIRSTASLIGTEGGDSWVWDCALLVPSKTFAGIAKGLRWDE